MTSFIQQFVRQQSPRQGSKKIQILMTDNIKVPLLSNNAYTGFEPGFDH